MKNFKEKVKVKFAMTKSWIKDHPGEAVGAVISTAFLGGLAIVIATTLKDAKINQHDWETLTNDPDFESGANQNPLDLRGHKIWDLYKMDKGEYMLQTEESKYYDENLVTKSVVITEMEVINN